MLLKRMQSGKRQAKLFGIHYFELHENYVNLRVVHQRVQNGYHTQPKSVAALI